MKMQGTIVYSLIIFSFALASASTLPKYETHNFTQQFEGIWRQRAEEAWQRTLKSYEPEPEKIVKRLSIKAHRTLKEIGLKPGSNSTRRGLAHGYHGVCMATNPIDRCWRCNPNWANNRFRLADCGLGFGYKAKGGKNGKFYTVTDPSDDDMLNPRPGTLRHAVIQKEPLWIIFAHDMLITLKNELIMTGDKTIDARGAKVHIAYGAGITIQFIRNVIIHGLRIHDIVRKPGGMIRDSVDHYGFRTESDGDGISIFGSQDVWVDHVSMTNCYDGLVDAIMGSTGITISNSHFTDHNEAMLFGANDLHTQDSMMQITVAFNHFGKRMIQRMPRCRFGFIHVVNNDYTHWQMYAIGGSAHPTIISQGNRYSASDDNGILNLKEVTKRVDAPESVWKNWTWRSQGDLFLRGAYFVESGDALFTSKHPELYDKIVAETATHVGEITRFAGSLGCTVGKPC